MQATNSLITFFHFDALAAVMITIVCLIGLTVGLYAINYMQGDKRYYRFFACLGALIMSVSVLSISDHLLVFLAAWGLSNLLLVNLMVHKPVWRPAVNSGWLAMRSFIFGFICLAAAFGLLYQSTGETSIQEIIKSSYRQDIVCDISLVLILIAAMTQSAIYPFHRWLISSLNSPTPVSAIMHAGLVNGGGFLLIRWSHLYINESKVLTLIFILGLGTAIIGTLWKLMQHDIKRMLACSTMAQMGFMFVQCGLGLFPAAVAHLCWHGMFKANLFLSSNNAAQEKRVRLDYSYSFSSYILACASGILSCYLFSIVTQQPLFVLNTTLIQSSIVFIAATQFSLTLLQASPWKRLISVLILCSAMSTLYGYSIYLFELVLSPLKLMHPQPLNWVYIIGLSTLMVAWVAFLFKDYLNQKIAINKYWPAWYVRTLNASQPHPSTITTFRNQYQYDRG